MSIQEDEGDPVASISASRDRWLRSVGSGVRALFAVELMVAGALKAIEPTDVVMLLTAAGLVRSASSWGGVLLASLEVCVGCALLLASNRRLVLIGAGCFALALLIGRGVILGLAGRESCGCFGDVEAPSWLVVGSLLVGGLACLGQAWSGDASGRGAGIAGRSAPSWRILVPLAAGCAVALVTLAGGAGAGKSSVWLVSRLGVPTAGVYYVCVVGSIDCEHCQEALERLQAGEGPGASAIERVFCLAREGESAGSPEELVAGVEYVYAPSGVWWSLLGEGGPTMLTWGNDGEPAVLPGACR